MARTLTLTLVDGRYAVIRLPPSEPFPSWLPSIGFLSITRTNTELSVVFDETVGQEAVGDETILDVQRGFRLLRFEGPFDFEETGVLASVAGPLADAAIPIFAMSTFDTDYVMVAGQDLDRTVATLRAHGHTVLTGTVLQEPVLTRTGATRDPREARRT